jgi:hypothetical protein
MARGDPFGSVSRFWMILSRLAAMRPTLGILLGLIGSLVLACSSQEAAPSASAEPASVDSAAVPTSSASAAVALRAPAGPRLAVLHAFPSDTAVFRLRRALLACTDGCATGTKGAPSKAETFIVDRAGSRKEPLFPEAAWRSTYKANESIFAERRRVTFSGSYPDELWAHLDAPFDRGGYGYVVPLRAGASGWEQVSEGREPVRVGCHLESSTRALVRDEGRCDDSGLSVAARRLLPSLSRTKESPERLVVLPNDGAVLLFAGGYARRSGVAWESRTGPWKAAPDAAVALDDGRFVVSSAEGVHVVSATEEVMPVVLTASDSPEASPIEGASSARLELVGGEVWVRFEHDGKVKLAAPGADTPWKRYLPPAPERAKGATEQAALEMPQPVNLTEACTTPFVMLASNNQPSYVFSASTLAFYGQTDFQDATFIQFSRDGATYFGLQTKTHEQAKKAVEIGKSAKLRPQLTCLDALGSIPDPVDPPAGVRVYFVNLARSTMIWP